MCNVIKYTTPIISFIEDEYSDLKLVKEYPGCDNIQIAKIYKSLLTKTKTVFIKEVNNTLLVYAQSALKTTTEIALNMCTIYNVFAPYNLGMSAVSINYSKLLLNDFMRCEQIRGIVIEDIKLGFIFISLDIPYTNLMMTWKEFISGGINRKIITDILSTQYYFDVIPWKNNMRFRTIPRSKTEIEITYICNSKEQHFHWLNEISLLTKGICTFRFYVDIEQLIKDEHMAYGLCRLLNHITECIPLIGTTLILIKNRSIISEVKKCLNEFIAYAVKNEEIVDIFTQQSIKYMNKFERMSLVGTGPYTFLNLYIISKNRKYKDPITREICDIDKDFVFENKLFNNFWKVGNIRNDPELILETKDSKIYFNIKIQNIVTNFWSITTEHSATEIAIQLIIIKWNDKTIFSNNICGTDPLLYFAEKALYAFSETLSYDLQKRIELINDC